MKSDASLPLDGQRILELAARSMFDLFANASEGMLLASGPGGKEIYRLAPDTGAVPGQRVH